MNIEILSCGTEKVKAISIVREATGWGIKEAKDFIDSIEHGSQSLDVTPDVAQKLKEIGVSIREAYDEEDEFTRMVNGDNAQNISSGSLNDVAEEEREKIHINQMNTNPNLSGNKYTPIVDSNMIQKLDRDSTMRVLIEAGKIAKESEEYDIEIAQLVKQKDKETKKAEELRGAVSKEAKGIIWSVTVIAAIVGFIFSELLCIVTGLVVFIIMNSTVKKSDLKKHEAENNANAENYLATYVAPIQARLDEVYGFRDELINCGKKAWAVDVVGEDLFYSACIQDLYNLIKNRRADNLKEALNKYDDAQYKQRMEEMQTSIQNASEISAREAVKQTAYSQEIAKSTHQTATAAKATAYHTRQIDKNTRKFRK
jgi:hypothetical protein